MKNKAGWILALSLLLVVASNALIHEMTIVNDARLAFSIENFGFFPGGTLHMSITDFKITDLSGAKEKPSVAFHIKHTETDSSAFIEENENRNCVMLEDDAGLPLGDKLVKMEATNVGKMVKEFVIPEGEEGFYSVGFVNCEDGSRVSFTLQMTMFNPGPNYLSAGLTPLPTIYFLLCLVYIVILVGWLLFFMRGEGKKVFRIHHLMTLLIVLKIFSLLFKGIEYHVKKTTGYAGGWAVPYYIFAGLRGITMFTVIALIGTGWAFVKPFLSEKDKKIFLVVIPLQIVSNVLVIVLEESAPGSQGWFTWKEVLRLVDIICCGAILVPIIWSIKHLRDAAQIDGKAKRNMEKLKLFRQFYLLVVTYIYFTRIIVYLMDATLPFHLTWLGDFFIEIATLIFWCLSGYKFRPITDNPFLSLEDEEGEDGEDAEGHRDGQREKSDGREDS